MQILYMSVANPRQGKFCFLMKLTGVISMMKKNKSHLISILRQVHVPPIRKYFYLLTLIGLDTLTLFFIYYTAPETNNMGLNYWLRTGFNRITLHFFPVVLFQTILLISDDIREWKSKT